MVFAVGLVAFLLVFLALAYVVMDMQCLSLKFEHPHAVTETASKE